MEKVILLKTQLAEAANFAKSKRFGHKRIAVILLDNFIELQLSALMKEKFSWGKILRSRKKMYSQALRVKILSHHDDLLKASVKEKIILSNEQKLLSFCHLVRNNLYHKGDEEELLTQVSILILYDLIIKYQPTWKSGRPVTSWTSKTVDPYNKTKKTKKWNGNSLEDWTSFLNKYFNCVDKRHKNASALLSEYLINKNNETTRYIKYIKEEYEIFFPYSKGWTFNNFLMYYSFFITQKDEIERIQELSDRQEARKQFENLSYTYKKNWRNKRSDRLKVLRKSYLTISTLPVYQALEKFTSYKEEAQIINQAFRQAASDLDRAVGEAIDRAREN